MNTLKDAQCQMKETVSPSLIKTPPSDVNCNNYKSFDFGLDLEQADQCIEIVLPEVEQEVEPDIKSLDC